MSISLFSDDRLWIGRQNGSQTLANHIYINQLRSVFIYFLFLTFSIAFFNIIQNFDFKNNAFIWTEITARNLKRSQF